MENALCVIMPILKATYNILKKIKCSNTIGICAPYYSGKSYFINSVMSKKYALLDLEANVELHMTKEEKDLLTNLGENSSKDLHYFPICKKYLEQIKKNHKGKKLLVFSSNNELLKYCGIYEIFNFVPSNSLADNIKLNLTEQQKKEFEANRIALMLKASNKVISFNSFDDFGKELVNKFKLQMKL